MDLMGPYNGRTYDVTLTNGPSITTGKYGNGLKLDGNDNYATGGDVLDFERTDPFTISLSINPDKVDVFQILVSKILNTGTQRG